MPESAGTPQLPHDIMGLAPEPFPWTAFLLALFALILLALGLGLFWKLYRSRQKARAASKASRVEALDPWTRMAQGLAALDVREPWDQAASEEFFFHLSFVLREALELRTGLPITGQTLAETQTSLAKSPALSANFQQDLLKFLSLSEQLKFAGQSIPATEAREWRDKVRTWLEDLRSGAQS